ncbi:hypothetical protein, partial [uncultured Faecalibaculum sp.]|uniref:hypothetical protein n=1 Tax=uncultured Faecalibaculum sp. TaxID=1729681 RepID=UPI00272DF6CB
NRTSNMKGAAVSLHLMVSKRTSATPFHFDSETLEVLSDLNNIRIFFLIWAINVAYVSAPGCILCRAHAKGGEQ